MNGVSPSSVRKMRSGLFGNSSNAIESRRNPLVVAVTAWKARFVELEVARKTTDVRAQAIEFPTLVLMAGTTSRGNGPTLTLISGGALESTNDSGSRL